LSLRFATNEGFALVVEMRWAALTSRQDVGCHGLREPEAAIRPIRGRMNSVHQILTLQNACTLLAIAALPMVLRSLVVALLCSPFRKGLFSFDGMACVMVAALFANSVGALDPTCMPSVGDFKRLGAGMSMTSSQAAFTARRGIESAARALATAGR
jgi:hypothetical protein